MNWRCFWTGHQWRWRLGWEDSDATGPRCIRCGAWKD